MNNREIIEKFFAGTSYLVRGKNYPQPLPPELEEWYCYTSDGGHSVLCLIEGEFKGAGDWTELCPVPVKAVLRGWRVNGEFIVAETVKYDKNIGLITQEGDDEF